jgi:arylsulfatase A-like enzyme
VRALLILVLLAAVLAVGGASAADRPPNVVVFLTDDQGWGDLSLNGNSNLATPNIDSLARNGALVERFFVCPVCSPTRAEFLTGRYSARGGVYNVSTGGERLDLDEKTIADTFKTAGYATGAFGKWHNGTQAPYHPNSRGFSEYYGFTSGHWGEYFSPELDHNGELVRGKGFITDDLTDHALDFMQRNRSKPFFCYLPYNTPHSPMQVPDRFYEKFRTADIKLRHQDPREDVHKTRAALAMCENTDWNVGRVLQKLNELKLAENTIVLYFHDNGPNGPRWNGGMKGVKGSLDEGGIRSPLLVRWTGHIRPGTRVTQVAGAIDILPTLTDLTGVRRVGTKPLDGISLKSPLLGEDVAWPDRPLVTYWRDRVSLRTRRFRLDAAGKLYDPAADPAQVRDLTAEHPDVATSLRAEAARWRAELTAELGKDDRPFTVGHSKTTFLPARDGEPHGNVKRSASAPNCSFFTNWISPEDRITWDVEVPETARYETIVYYTCPAASVGSTVELSLNEARISKKITEAHDPPLRGIEHDRHDRGPESFVKDFKPLKLGTVDLKKGRGPLTLRALEVPGKQVMDVRYVVLSLAK